MILTKVPESERSSTESGSSNKVPALIPFEEHQRLIDEAAKRASRETLESFRKLNREAIGDNDRESSGSGDTGLEGDDEGEIDFFATKTNKSIRNMVNSVATLKRAFEQPPSQIESMLYNAFTQNMVQKLTGEGVNAKKNWYDEILGSLAHGIGARAPELVDTLTRNFGSDWVKQTATGLLNPGAVINSGGPGGGYGGQGGMGGGQQQGQGNRGTGGKGELNQEAVDQIMALDPNNPAHVSAYAEIQGNIDINDARKMLQIHQDIFMNKMKRNAAQSGMEIPDVREVRNTGIPPNVPVNPNSDIPPVWAQALMGKVLELENKISQFYAGSGVVKSVEDVGGEGESLISYVDKGIGKVQTAEEFQKELEEETRREKQKNGIVSGNVNKWEDEPGTAVGMISKERRLEEEQMRKKPVHDASVELIMREVEIQKEKLEIVESANETVDEHVEIPVDINADIDKIEEEINKEEKKEEKEEVVSSVIEEQKESEKTKEVSKFKKGSQGWLKEQKELKEKK